MAASLPGRHRGLIAVPHSRNEVTRDLRDLLHPWTKPHKKADPTEVESAISFYAPNKKLYTLNSTLTTDSKPYTLNFQLKRPSDKDRPMYTIF